LLLTTALAGCGSDSVESPSGGDPFALGAPDRTLEWAPETVFSVGGLEAPDWATFGSVTSVAFDGVGNLYIFDGQTSVVTVVSPEGDFLRTVGRLGEGPGEVSRAMAMTVTPDGHTVIPDLGKRGLVVYDAQGEWAGNVLLNLAAEGLPSRGIVPLPGGAVAASDALRMVVSTSGDDEDVRMTRPESRPVWVYPTEPGGEPVLAHEAWNPPPPPAGGESSLESEGEGGAMQIQLARMQAFTPGLHLAALPDGRLAVVDSVDYSIGLVTVGEGLTGRLRRPLDPVEVTPAIEELERERQLDEIVGREGRMQVLGGPGMTVNADAMRRMMEDQVDKMAFFPQIPVVEALAADPLGRIWVQRSSGTPGEDGPTDLVTADGRYLGTLPPDGLRIPDAFGPDGLAAIVETDEFDVATVRVVRLPVEPR
jgi:hypothetical protein